LGTDRHMMRISVELLAAFLYNELPESCITQAGSRARRERTELVSIREIFECFVMRLGPRALAPSLKSLVTFAVP
jgi:hypothetical protein